MPELRQLNEATIESVHLAVMQGHALVKLAKLDSVCRSASAPMRPATAVSG